MLASMIFQKEPFFHGQDNYDQVPLTYRNKTAAQIMYLCFILMRSVKPAYRNCNFTHFISFLAADLLRGRTQGRASSFPTVTPSVCV